MIDTEKLCIEPGKKVFVVFVDIYVLNHDGNLIDAAALAAVAALMNTKMPNYKVEDGEVKFKPGYTQLPVKQHPITVTCAKIGDKLVVDPWLEEEQAMDARISMAIDDGFNICAIQKGENGFFEPKQVLEAAKIAKDKAKELRKQLDW
jgi:exosome complex component RRP42